MFCNMGLTEELITSKDNIVIHVVVFNMLAFFFLPLEFQDSRLSPALALLPEYDFSGYSLFQQTTDLEFAPLR